MDLDDVSVFQTNACAVEARSRSRTFFSVSCFRRTLVRLKPPITVHPLAEIVEFQTNACAVEADRWRAEQRRTAVSDERLCG